MLQFYFEKVKTILILVLPVIAKGMQEKEREEKGWGENRREKGEGKFVRFRWPPNF